MFPDGTILAWIETIGEDVLVFFIGVPAGLTPANCRPPAVRRLASVPAARQWMENEAKALGLPLEWVNGRARS